MHHILVQCAPIYAAVGTCAGFAWIFFRLFISETVFAHIFTVSNENQNERAGFADIFFGPQRNPFRLHFPCFERKTKMNPVSNEKLKWTAHHSCSRCTDNKKIVRHFRTKMKNTTISALSWPSNFNYRLTTLINNFFRWPLKMWPLPSVSGICPVGCHFEFCFPCFGAFSLSCPLSQRLSDCYGFHFACLFLLVCLLSR